MEASTAGDSLIPLLNDTLVRRLFEPSNPIEMIPTPRATQVPGDEDPKDQKRQADEPIRAPEEGGTPMHPQCHLSLHSSKAAFIPPSLLLHPPSFRSSAFFFLLPPLPFSSLFFFIFFFSLFFPLFSFSTLISLPIFFFFFNSSPLIRSPPHSLLSTFPLHLTTTPSYLTNTAFSCFHHHHYLPTQVSDENKGSPNERFLFHGSLFMNSIINKGFDERHAYIGGMFGAGGCF